MVLGSSVAHGMASKSFREAVSLFKEREEQIIGDIKKIKFKRAAHYRFIQKALEFLYQEYCIAAVYSGDRSGKDKTAYYIIAGLKPSIYVEKDMLEQPYFDLVGHVVLAKSPAIDFTPTARLSRHAVARFMQTYGLSDINQIFKSNVEDANALIYASRVIKADPELALGSNKAWQVYGNRGLIKFVFIPEKLLIDVKTVISYDSMTPSQSVEYKALAGKEMLSKWHNYREVDE